MGKNSSHKKMKSKQLSVKHYELNVYHKRSAQLSEVIYMLPLDIKFIIFKMAIDTHMKEWEKKHRLTVRSWYGLKTRYKPFSWLDLIKGWGIQAPKNKYFPYIHANVPGAWGGDIATYLPPGDQRGNIPDEYKIKLCDRDNVIKDMNGTKTLLNSKTDIFHCRRMSGTLKFAALYYAGVFLRHVRGEEPRYWVHKKCRCLTCDLIRLHSIKAHKMSYHSYKEEIKQKYSRIEYINDGQWKTYTESQVNPTTKEKLLLNKCKNK